MRPVIEILLSSDALVSPGASLVSLALAIAGLVAAYVFYKKALRSKEPSWDYRGLVILEEISPSLSSLKMYFGDTEINRVAVGRVAFWNAGKETIHRGDIVLTDPIRIESIDGGQVLEVKVLATNNIPSAIDVRQADTADQVLIEFEYLDQSQGAVFQFITTSTQPLVV